MKSNEQFRPKQCDMKSTQRKNGNNRRVSYKQYVRILGKHKKDLYERYKVREIGIFGSYVRDEQNQRSDLDVLVEFDEIPGLLKFIQLEDYLGAMLKHKVDLVHKKALRPELRDIILSEVSYV